MGEQLTDQFLDGNSRFYIGKMISLPLFYRHCLVHNSRKTQHNAKMSLLCIDFFVILAYYIDRI